MLKNPSFSTTFQGCVANIVFNKVKKYKKNVPIPRVADLQVLRLKARQSLVEIA